ncbi:hypothetical protein WKH15_21715 [Pantoea agglomerans]|uniref:hypothetical protein n=1 Tax=Enterobacter agglomerans TaxID=549 RepID=UPI003C7B837A
MSHNPFIVQFPNGSRLYGVSNGSGLLLRPLFRSPEEAMNYPREALYNALEPSDASHTEDKVIIEPGEAWESENRASLKAMWLTGPQTSNERLTVELNGESGMYGGYDYSV